MPERIFFFITGVPLGGASNEITKKHFQGEHVYFISQNNIFGGVGESQPFQSV